MQEFVKIFQNYLDEYETITIYRHTHPDTDALGAQFGLKQWIIDNYPQKKVYALGIEKSDVPYFPQSDDINDEIISNSLAIAVDCGNLDRIDDQRIKLAKKILKIDHHPNVEPYGDHNLVDTNCASCTQLLATIFKEIDYNSVLSACSTYLYRGLLTDSLCYKTSSTTAKTLEIGAYLASKDIDIRKINLELFDVDLQTFKLQTIVRNKIKLYHDHIAYCIFDLDELKEYNLEGKKAREFVNEMGNIKEFAIWAIFTQRKDSNGQIVYDGSLRSKYVAINQIASKYNGGGHPNASGIKNLTENDLNNILEDLQNILSKQND